MLDSLATEIGTLIQTHQAWAGPIVGLVVFAESLAVIGLLMPASALMLLTGGLIGSGVLDPLAIGAWAVAGAVIGDAVSYFVGRLLGPGISRRWPLNRHRPSVARARLFFRKYGIASIFFGRFLGPVRSTVPLVAGTLLMSQRRFQTANVLSALVWVPVILAPGYLLARGLGSAEGTSWTGLTVGITIMTIAGTTVAIYVLRRAGQRRRERHRPARPVAPAR